MIRNMRPADLGRLIMVLEAKVIVGHRPVDPRVTSTLRAAQRTYRAGDRSRRRPR